MNRKKILKLGLIALLAAIGFSIIACDNGSTGRGGGSGNSGNSGNQGNQGNQGGNSGNQGNQGNQGDNSGNQGNQGNQDGNNSVSGGYLYAKAPPVSLSDTPVDLSDTAGATIVDKAFTYVKANPGTYTLLLTSDIDVAENTIRTLNQPNVNLTITGLDTERKIRNFSTSLSYYLLTVGDSMATELTDISLTLGNNVTLLGWGVFVTGGATFVMQDNAKITNSRRGVSLTKGHNNLETTTFTIQDNASVSDNGTGSGIEGGAGVGVGEDCLFIMKDDASVSNNRGYAYGGGVCVDGGTFNMYGGTLSGNTVGYFGGGGVYVGTSLSRVGTFNMYGGTVSGNKATDGYGGGVYVDASCTFIMSGGTVYGSDEPSLVNTARISGAALYSEGTAKYGDGSNILPHTDSQNRYTNNTITGR